MENQNYTGPSPVLSAGSGEANNEEVAKGSFEKQDLEDNKDSKPQSPQQEEEQDEENDMGEKSKMATYSDDPTKVKFTNSSMVNHADGSNNGDAKVDIENVQLSFAGMGKEELMKFADDPFWVRLRWILFALFWFVWVAMLAGAIIIVLTTPGCPPPPKRDWWHKGVIYQVYPQSFKDSNGDGVGDIKGIESKLDYVKDLGVNAIWLNPIFPSPMKDGGYDISNYTDINKLFGTLDDFKSLLQAAKEKGLRILLDFVPNHTSDQHDWFLRSRINDTKYSDYYIWKDNIKPHLAPNNWLSVFGGPAWAFDSKRNQYFLHQFLDSQPDLNLRNPNVREELKKVLEFWLDLGVAGFRVDAMKHLFERDDLLDEPAGDPTAMAESYESLNHIYTTGLPESLEILQEWREILDGYKEKDGEHRLLLVEVPDSLPNTMQYYGNETNPLADFPFNFELVNLKAGDGAREVFKAVDSWNSSLPKGAWPNWVLGNHDVSRIATRMGEHLIDAFNMIIMLLEGTPVTYYGEEIGMTNGFVPYAQLKDPLGKSHSRVDYEKFARDFERTPMQWNNETFAGFTTSNETYLPLANNYATLNVEIQIEDDTSHLNIYKKLVKLREEQAIIYGQSHFLVNNNDTFSFARVKKGTPGFAVIVNFSANETFVDIKSGKHSFKFPDEGVLEIRSGITARYIARSGSKVVKLPLAKIALGPTEVVLIKFVPSFD